MCLRIFVAGTDAGTWMKIFSSFSPNFCTIFLKHSVCMSYNMLWFDHGWCSIFLSLQCILFLFGSFSCLQRFFLLLCVILHVVRFLFRCCKRWTHSFAIQITSYRVRWWQQKRDTQQQKTPMINFVHVKHSNKQTGKKTRWKNKMCTISTFFFSCGN